MGVNYNLRCLCYSTFMKVGIFDSGLGGLIVTKAIVKVLPEYDYVYLGDTKRVPYGNRSHDAVYEFTRECIEYLFEKEDCAIVVVACNTASARALFKLEQRYMPQKFPDRKILGVLVPAAEEAAKYSRVGVLGTLGTIASGTFPDEIRKIKPKKNNSVKVFQNAAPLLVPLAEEGEKKLVKPFLQKYLKPLLSKKVEAVLLGCTHYPIFKSEIKKLLPKKTKIISQDEIMPRKLKNFLEKNPELEMKLSKEGKVKILVTDETQTVDNLTRKWFGDVEPTLINL
jgi:glutamate racemase